MDIRRKKLSNGLCGNVKPTECQTKDFWARSASDPEVGVVTMTQGSRASYSRSPGAWSGGGCSAWTPEDGPVSSPKPVDIMKAHLDDFGSQLKAKDGIFQDFEKEIKRSLLESAQSKKQLQKCREQCHRQQKEILSVRQYKHELFVKSKEEKVSSLGSEVILLKSKLQEKMEQSQQLQDQVVKQQEALSRAYRTVKDTRKAAGRKIWKKEMELGAVQKELLQVQTQLSECKKELLLRENLLQKLKEETVQLTAQIKEQSQDINKLNSERKKLELEMTVVMEKHRTAHQEVSRRDQELLQLKTDLKMAEERLNGTQEEMVHRTKAIEQLKSDLSSTQNAHAADTQRWKQKLDEAQQDLQEAQGAAQERGLQVEELLKKLQYSEALLSKALHKVQERDAFVQKYITDASLLKLQVEKAQADLRESRAMAENHESMSDVFKRKYQSTVETVGHLEGRIEGLEEEVQYANSQVCKAHETISGLRAEILSLERRYKQKCSHVENSEEAVEQLTEDLQSTREDLRMSREQMAECERLIQTLQERLSKQQEELSERESTLLKLQSEMTSYQVSHSYSNEEYKAKQQQCVLLRKELESVKRQHNAQANGAAEFQGTILALKAEAASLGMELRRREDENRALERALQSLHLDVASAHQDHKVVLAQLEQEVGQLESDLADARRVCAQKEQALRKREDLLKGSEANLIQATEAMDIHMQELQQLQGAVEDLKRDTKVLQVDKKQKEQENMVLRAQVRKLKEELQELKQQPRDTAQVFASREQRLILLDLSLSATQQQLSEHVAEATWHEQSTRNMLSQLRSTQEESTHLRQMVDKLKVEASSKKSFLHQPLQEVPHHQQERQRAEVEHAKAREEALALTCQLQQQEKLLQRLREDPGQEQNCSLNQQEQLYKLQRCMIDMEAEVERLKVMQTNDTHVLKDRESHISRLGETAEIQEKHSRLPEEFLETESRLTVSNLRTAASEPPREQRSEEEVSPQDAKASIRTYSKNVLTAEQKVVDLQKELSSVKQHLEEAQKAVESLKTEQGVLRDKLEAVTAELKTERKAAGETRAENARLHLDKDQLVSSVSRWIKEQKIASESLAGKIKEQNNLLSVISAEKNHLQETKDAMEVELKKLRAMSNEKEKEIEHLKAQGVRHLSANHQVLLNQLSARLEVQETGWIMQISQNLCEVEDLQSRVKANMESMALLNQQLSALSSENVNRRKELDVEQSHCRRLEKMLQSTGQSYLSPRTPSERPLLSPARPSTP